ncbi:MAG TPA: PAS domain S-box protein [Prolixibacteraceae bacterium]|nr:PAS domain S-box protein [Prolixibacteraceae bacterium]
MQTFNQDKRSLPDNDEIYRSMIENSRDGICITQNFSIRYANNAFCCMTGYESEELIGSVASDLLAHSDKERMSDLHQQSRKGLQSEEVDFTTLVHKNGSLVDIEYTATAITYNNETAAFISARDITERKRMQEKLEQSEQKYRNLVENAKDGIIITQFGKFKFVNKAFCGMIEYTEEELMELNFLNVVAEEDRERLMEYHRLRMNGSKHQMIYEAKGISKSGKIIHFEINTSYIDYNGNPATFIILRDHTEQKALEQTLKASERKYRKLFEAESDAIFLIEKETGKILDANPAATRIYGYSHEEFLNLYNVDISAEPDKTKEATAKDSTFVPIRYHKKKDQTVFAVEISAGVTDLDNKQVHIITARDITERLRMQNELAESESIYRTLIEKSLDGIVITQDQKVIMVNKAFADMLGFTIEECIAGFGPHSLAPEDRERVMDIHNRRMKGGLGDMRYKASLICKNGKKVTAEFNSTTIELNGKLASLISTRDITSQLKMQEAIEKSERKYRELADMLPQTIYELDKDGNGTYLNKAGRIAMGLTGDDVSFYALDGVIPEDRPGMIESMKRCFQEKRINYFNEYTALRRDGSTFPAIFYASAMIENEEFVGTRGLIIDISERKAMEEALRKSEEHYRRVIQSLQEGLFVLQDEKFIFVNDSIVNILGYTVEEITGRHFSSVIPPEHSEEAVQKYMERQLGTIGSWSYEINLLHKDGHTRVPVILSTNLTEFDGKPAIVGTAKDITDRVKAEKEIKEAHKRLEQINMDLEKTVRERTRELTRANTQLLKLQKENLQSQFDVLKQQVNPHFLFNSLNVLTSLIRLEPELAEKFTEHLAKVYRYVLENKDNELVNLSTELGFLNAYIFLINIRFMDKVQVNIRIEDNKMNYQIIPLAMQLLIENAIKHNAMSKRSPLVIDIFIDSANRLNVVNNLQEREAHMTSTGVGLKNIQNRYRLLNNTIPAFEKTNTHFIAKIPLIG